MKDVSNMTVDEYIDYIDGLLEEDRLKKITLVELLKNNISLQAENQKDGMYIFHPCTKGNYKYQVSFFYKGEPWSDITRDTLDEIAKELIMYGSYEIIKTISA